jgi:predicted RNA-binding Zn-ribbon protein involved in translation (DUF1610 family)
VIRIPVGEEVLMGDRVETTCSRCGEEIVVMTAGEYLSSTDADLDFVLHAHERESRIAVKSEVGVYSCPSCGRSDRVPVRATIRLPRAGTGAL